MIPKRRLSDSSGGKNRNVQLILGVKMHRYMLRILADRGADIARFAWISFQPNGSISIGLSDKAWYPPEFEVYHGVWSAYNRKTLDYVVPNDPKALKPASSPHLTFHPPHSFHFTKEPGKKPFFAIADVDLAVQQDGSLPWVKFTSKPVSKLQSGVSEREGAGREDGCDVVLTKADGEYSVGLIVDFLDPARTFRPDPSLNCKIIEWLGRKLLVAVEHRPVQRISTIAWTHSY